MSPRKKVARLSGLLILYVSVCLVALFPAEVEAVSRGSVGGIVTSTIEELFRAPVRVTAAPTNGDLVEFNSTSGNWEAASVPIGGIQAVALLDGVEHTDTAASTVVRADVIVGNATPEWERLAKGTANQVLTMDGTATDVVWATIVGNVIDTLQATVDSGSTTTTAMQATGANTFGATTVLTQVAGTLDVDEAGTFDTTLLVTGVATFTASPTSPAAGTSSEAWGSGATATADSSLAIIGTADTTVAEDELLAIGVGAVALGDEAHAIGFGATTGAGSGVTVYGNNATTTGDPSNATVMGNNASATGSNGTAFGQAATAGSNSCAFGQNVSTAATAISIGNGTAAAASGVVIGFTATNGGNSNSMAFGRAATNTGASQVTFGSTAAAISEFQTGTRNNGQYLSITSATELLATTSGATVTTTSLIPAGVQVLHVACRVTTAVTTSSAGNTFDVGDASDADNWGDEIAGALNTIQDHDDYTANPTGTWSASAREVILDATAAETFTAGAVRVTVWYSIPTAPGS